jgi:pyruvate ferredoxin oxidoreductase alpha subunit
MGVTTTKTVAVTGNQAVAEALRQLNPDVMPAYPITPSTGIMESFTSFVSNGKVDTEMVLVESEHSAMSAAIGASAAGGRVATATSSQGMALMWEMLHIASGYRLPILMALVNRALSAPLNIHGDHSDGMGSRDTGWIQLYSRTPRRPTTTRSWPIALPSTRRCGCRSWSAWTASSPATP